MKRTKFDALGDQLQTFGNPLMHFPKPVTAMPVDEARLIGPIGDEPDFIRIVRRADHIQALKTGDLVHEMRPVPEGPLDFRNHIVSHGKSAQGHKHAHLRHLEGRITQFFQKHTLLLKVGNMPISFTITALKSKPPKPGRLRLQGGI
jgi:hypothetical protein